MTAAAIKAKQAETAVKYAKQIRTGSASDQTKGRPA